MSPWQMYSAFGFFVTFKSVISNKFCLYNSKSKYIFVWGFLREFHVLMSLYSQNQY